MKLRTGLILSAVLAGGVLVLAPTNASAQEPKENMFTRSATLYLSQAQTQADPEERRQRYVEALNVSRDGIENEPSNPRSYLHAGRALVGLGDFLAADSMFNRAVVIWPDYAAEVDPVRENAWVQAYNQAIPAINAGNTEEAIAQLERAHMIYKGRPEAMLNLGQQYTATGDTEMAIDMYAHALELIRSPLFDEQDERTQTNWTENDQISAFNMAQLLAQSDRNAEAATAYEEFLALNPGHLQALTNLAIVLTNMEMADSAQAIYTALLDREDLTPRDYFNAGIGLFQSEQYELAATAFERVVVVAPESRDANYNLAQALYLIEDYDRLVPVSTKLVALDPYNQNSHTFYVRALLMSGAEEEAQVAYDYMEAMPIEVYDLQLAPLTSGGGSVTGQVENRGSEEGATIGVRVHFISSDGVDVGTADVDVQLTALETSTSFRAEIEAEQQLLAYWYEITTDVPTVELPEEAPDTTGTGNGN